MSTNEGNHIRRELDASESRIEDELRNLCRRLNLGLQYVRLERVEKSLLQEILNMRLLTPCKRIRGE